ncbi:MAG: alpha-glucan family phosphorylase, partial [Chloroflexi bacterium]|nr:alpha-glucan family phosphorylase [Chloroflexota bacterium]
TPVSAGHDTFALDLVREVLGEERMDFLRRSEFCPNGCLSMTELALGFSRYVNGVSMRHETVSRTMFSNHPIDAISNGVHAATWASPPFQRIYDRYIPQWRRDNLYLRYAIGIPREEIWGAHMEAKQELMAEVKRCAGVSLDAKVMTLGFARRATGYKRTDLLFHDLERLRSIAQRFGPLQVIFGGKAHPSDEFGKELIRRVFRAAAALRGVMNVVYLEGYDIGLAKYVCSGVDVWLNTPQKSLEASGTSGMKAALNGVPSLSVLDGWWIEGHVEGVTGWSIGNGWRSQDNLNNEVASLYDKIEHVIMPLFYQHQDDFAGVMRSAIALNGSYFNAQRMLFQYLHNAYLRAANPVAGE